MGNDVAGLTATLELPLAGRDAYAQRFPGLLPGCAAGSGDACTQMGEYAGLSFVVRSRELDSVVRQRIAADPRTIVVDCGCGLDTVASRLSATVSSPQQHPAAPQNRFAPQGNQERK